MLSNQAPTPDSMRGRRELRLFGLSFSGGFLHAYPILPPILPFFTSFSIPSPSHRRGSCWRRLRKAPCSSSQFRHSIETYRLYINLIFSVNSHFIKVLLIYQPCIYTIRSPCISLSLANRSFRQERCTKRMHDVVVSLLACKVLILRSLWMWGRGKGIGIGKI